MARPASPYPTPGETEILQVFWRRGVATVRDVHDDLNKSRKRSFTTVATIVRIMLDKRLLKIVDKRRPQKFKAAIDDKATLRLIVNDLKDRWFDGSAKKLVLGILAQEAKDSGKLTAIDKELKKLTIK